MRSKILKVIFLFLSFFISSKENAWPIVFQSEELYSLSKDARISVITCAPGKEMYSVFGHTALRISDPTNRIDKVHNYGTFDFNNY